MTRPEKEAFFEKKFEAFKGTPAFESLKTRVLAFKIKTGGCYYKLSPPVAAWMKDKPKINNVVKRILDFFIDKLS